jgi:hypothetical protein
MAARATLEATEEEAKREHAAHCLIWLRETPSFQNEQLTQCGCEGPLPMQLENFQCTRHRRIVKFAAGVPARVALADLRSRFMVDGGSLEDGEGIVVSGDKALAKGAVYTFTDYNAAIDPLFWRRSFTFDLTGYKSFEELMNGSLNCRFMPVCDANFTDYMVASSEKDTSFEKVSKSSTSNSISTSSGNIIEISKFRRSCCENTQSKFRVFHWNLHDSTLSEVIGKYLFGGEETRMQGFLCQQIANLNSVRAIFSGLYESIGSALVKPKHFQPVFTLFFEQLVGALGPDVIYDVKPAQGMKLEGKIYVSDTSTDTYPSNRVVEKKLKGFTDLFVVDTTVMVESDLLDLNSSETGQPLFLDHLIGGTLVSHAELTLPFDILYRKSAAAAKDQLLAQSEAIAQMGTTNQNVTGMLTDIFALVISIRRHAERVGRVGYAEHFIAHPVVEAKSYLLRLLLLLCPEEAALSLLPSRDAMIPLPVEEECDDADDRFGQSGAVIPNNGREADSQTQKNKASSPDFSIEVSKEVQKEEFAEGVIQLQIWDSTRRGFAPLTLSELKKRSMEKCSEKAHRRR